LKKEAQFEEHKWRANWQRMMAQLLEQYPPHPSDLRQDFFPGFYYLNSMQIQISRKQQMARLVKVQEQTYFDKDEMQSLVQKQNNWIGKDIML